MTSIAFEVKESVSARDTKSANLTQPGGLSKNEILRLVTERRNSVEGDAANFANSANSHTPRLVAAPTAPESDDVVEPSWPEPELFNEEAESEPYPIGSLPPILRNSVLEVHEATQAPLAMVACSAICATSAACQALIDVRRDEQLKGPVSLFFVVLGESGERKSTVDSFFIKPLKDFHQRVAEESKPERKKHNSAMAVWSAKCAAVETLIKAKATGKVKAGSKDEEDSLAQLEDRLAQLHLAEPVAPLSPKLLITDITQEKLVQQLGSEWPSCAMIAAEGGVVFGGRSLSKDNQLSTLATFNSLWSGDHVQVSRKTGDSFELDGVRMSLSLLVQPSVFYEFVSNNPLARQVGFFARCLFAFPPSTQGNRLYKRQKASLPALDELRERIASLLAMDPLMEDRRLTPNAIPLSQEAMGAWIETHDQIERQLAKGGTYQGLRDFGSKAAENVARLAAVFQISEKGPIVEVSEENIRRASTIVDWHMAEAKRCFSGTANPSDQSELDAKELLQWMIGRATATGMKTVSTEDLGRIGPNRMRLEKNRAEKILFLIGRRCIRKVTDRSSYEINPALLSRAQAHD
jgi:hypothetical protein